MFWEKKVIKEEKKSKVNALRVYFYDKGWTEWTTGDEWTGEDKLEPWKNFHEWFMNSDTELFVFYWANGINVFRRKDIRSYSITVTEE